MRLTPETSILRSPRPCVAVSPGPDVLMISRRLRPHRLLYARRTASSKVPMSRNYPPAVQMLFPPQRSLLSLSRTVLLPLLLPSSQHPGTTPPSRPSLLPSPEKASTLFYPSAQKAGGM
uniref:Uncharacterized protein n=1 Tax=Knipowitschia caucasica TaxID=637954 RepID=A0AAV2KIA3_KNICA